jgi:hypothetical protein
LGGYVEGLQPKAEHWQKKPKLYLKNKESKKGKEYGSSSTSPA